MAISVGMLLAAAVAGRADVTTTGDTNNVVQGANGVFTSEFGDFSTMYVGIQDLGSMQVDGGSTFQGPYQPNVDLDSLDLGLGTNSTGIVVVTGETSRIEAPAAIVIGDSGTGVMEINNGGQVGAGLIIIGGGLNNFGTGTVNVDGVGSSIGGRFGISVGNFGGGTMTLTNGASAFDDNGFVGGFSGSIGSASVESGSVWTCSNSLVVGDDGTGNMTISSGGFVEAQTGYIGAGFDGTYGTGNLLVTGSGSTLLMDGGLFISSGEDGNLGSGNLTVSDHGVVTTGDQLQVGGGGIGIMLIESGGNVTAASLSVGAGATGNGTLKVTGAGSLLTVTGMTYVGLPTAGTVEVTDGAKVISAGISVGNNPGGAGQITISGSTSSWTASGPVYVGGGGPLATGNLTVTAGGTFSNINGFLFVATDGVGQMTVDTKGTVFTLGGFVVGNNVGGIGNVSIDGAGTTWTSGVVFVGGEGTGTMSLTNHAKLTIINNELVIANNVGGGGTVTVNNSTIAISNNGIFVGASAPGSMTISNGGTVGTADFVTIGTVAGNPGPSTLTVQDQGSSLTGGSYFIGDGANGSLTISGGATVTAQSTYIGYHTGAVGCVTITSDPSGTLSTLVAGDMTVGVSGTANVTVNGGKITGNNLIIGSLYQGDSNGVALDYSLGSMTLDGATSTASFSGNARIGDQGDGNLTIRNGASVTVGGDATIANDGLDGKFHSFGKIVVSSGSTLGVTGDISIGEHGTGEMDISTGSQVTSATGFLGSSEGIGTLKISGSLSKWTITNALSVQKQPGSVPSTFSITEAGSLEADSASFYNLSDPATGIAVVSDPGSNLTLHHNLFIDNGNLRVQNGGNVSANFLRVGYGSGASGLLVITGTDTNGAASTVTVADAQFSYDTFAQVNVVKGANLFATTLTTGVTPDLTSGQGGILSLSDIGSNVTISGQVILAQGGQSTLTIANNASFTGGPTTLGQQAGSTGNATVTKGVWTVNGQLIVGDAGNATIKLDGDAILLTSSSAIIGNQAGANGTVSIGPTFTTGNSALWNAGNLTIGGAGSGTLLLDNEDTVNADLMVVADSGTGNVKVGAGTIHATSLHMGSQAGANGLATFGDQSATDKAEIEIANEVVVADSGNATMNVLFGARLSAGNLTVGNATGSMGFLNVDGKFADNFGAQTTVDLDTVFVAGESGSSQSIFSNGSLLKARSMIIADAASTNFSAQNVVVFDHSDAQFTGNIIMGFFGTNQLFVQNGGTMSAGDMTVGNFGTVITANTINITNPNSTLTLTGQLALNVGIMKVTNFALVNAHDTAVGSPPNSQGHDGTAELLVDQSTFHTNSLVINDNTNGATMFVQNGGHVTATSILLGNGSSGFAQITIDGGLSVVSCTSGTVDIGKFGNAKLRLSNFGELFANDTNVYPGGIIDCQDGTIAANVINKGGQVIFSHDPLQTFQHASLMPAIAGDTIFHPNLQPAYSPTNFSITGDYTQTDGTLTLEIGGDDETLVDQFLVSGNITLAGGILDLSFTNGYLPKQGDTFDLLPDSDALIGTPNITYQYDGLAPGFQFSVTDIKGNLVFTALNDAQPADVPEPTSLLLLGMGGLLLRRRGR